jgi:hypothetical protein
MFRQDFPFGGTWNGQEFGFSHAMNTVFAIVLLEPITLPWVSMRGTSTPSKSSCDDVELCQYKKHGPMFRARPGTLFAPWERSRLDRGKEVDHGDISGDED